MDDGCKSKSGSCKEREGGYHRVFLDRLKDLLEDMFFFFLDLICCFFCAGKELFSLIFSWVFLEVLFAAFWFFLLLFLIISGGMFIGGYLPK